MTVEPRPESHPMRLLRGRLVFHLRLLMLMVLVLGVWMGWKVNRAQPAPRRGDGSSLQWVRPI